MIQHAFKTSHLLQAAVSAVVFGLTGSVQGADLCATRSQSQALAIVICTSGASQPQWRDAGTAACKDKSQCNAWIWDDASKAPQAAPATDSDIPKAQVGDALAIWASDVKQLIVLRKTK
jgi:hypothetical protein